MSEQLSVNFITPNGYTYTVDMSLEKLKFLAEYKPLLDAENGTEVFRINEFRYDIDEDQFTFWLGNVNDSTTIHEG